MVGSPSRVVDPLSAYLTNSEDPLSPDHLASLLARATSGDAREQQFVRVHKLSARLGEAKCDELCRRYEAGETAQALAAANGVSKPAVLTLLRTRNVTVRGKKLTREQIAKAVVQYEAGKSISEVARALEFTPTAIWRALKVEDVHMRPKGFQPKQGPVGLQ